MHTCCTCLLLNVTSTHSPSICPSLRRHLLISALFMHLPTVLWVWIRAPATHLISALPQHLPSPLSVSDLSSQYLFQQGPIWFLYTLIFIHLSQYEYDHGQVRQDLNFQTLFNFCQRHTLLFDMHLVANRGTKTHSL